jgi:hypothetical protein
MSGCGATNQPDVIYPDGYTLPEVPENVSDSKPAEIDNSILFDGTIDVIRFERTATGAVFDISVEEYWYLWRDAMMTASKSESSTSINEDEISELADLCASRNNYNIISETDNEGNAYESWLLRGSDVFFIVIDDNLIGQYALSSPEQTRLAFMVIFGIDFRTAGDLCSAMARSCITNIAVCNNVWFQILSDSSYMFRPVSNEFLEHASTESGKRIDDFSIRLANGTVNLDEYEMPQLSLADGFDYYYENFYYYLQGYLYGKNLDTDGYANDGVNLIIKYGENSVEYRDFSRGFEDGSQDFMSGTEKHFHPDRSIPNPNLESSTNSNAIDNNFDTYPIPVPDLIGLDKSTAQYAIQNAGFRLGTVRYEESNATTNSIIAQTPSAGDVCVPGMSVSFTVSIGSENQNSYQDDEEFGTDDPFG